MPLEEYGPHRFVEPEMVRAATRLHSDDAGRNLTDKINERLPPNRSANSYRTFVVDADDTAAIFADIDTQN
jgi:hypothetical protein